MEASNGFILFRMWCIVNQRRALLLRLRQARLRAGLSWFCFPASVSILGTVDAASGR